MKLPPETIQKIEKITEAALIKIGAEKIPKKVALAVKFAQSQPAVEIILNGTKTTSIAVDIATVFSLEGDYRQYVDQNNRVRTVESIQALSVVIIGDRVSLCKSTYDVLPGFNGEADRFFNIKYWDTDVEQLTEEYIC